MPRPLAWADTIINQPLVGAASQVNLNLLVDLAPSDTITVARLVINLRYTTDSITQALEGAMVVDQGIQVVTAQAFAVGGVSVPQANISAEVPARGWLWRYRALVLNKVEADGDVWHYVDRAAVDLRTMRKVDRGILIYSVKTNVIHGTVYNTKVVGIIRALCMT